MGYEDDMSPSTQGVSSGVLGRTYLIVGVGIIIEILCTGISDCGDERRLTCTHLQD